jgi:hypothetical protein
MMGEMITAAQAVGVMIAAGMTAVGRGAGRMMAIIPAPAPAMMTTVVQTMMATMATMTTMTTIAAAAVTTIPATMEMMIAIAVATTIPATMMITAGQAMTMTMTMTIAAQGVVEMTKPGPPSVSLRCLPA